jgi:signal transduction histidine kinase/CheY-like chemotaxis protein
MGHFMQYTPYTIPLVIAAILASGVAAYAWKHRSIRSAVPFAILATAIAGWTLGYALQLTSVTLEAKRLFANFEYIGITIVPVAWLIFTVDFSNSETWVSRRYLAWLMAIPTITIVLAWTDQHHGLVRTHEGLEDTGQFVLAITKFGPWFWVHAIYSYVLLVTGTVVIARFLIRSPPLYKRQAFLILASVLGPTFLNVIYLLKLSPFPNLDLTPFGFIIMGLASFWALHEFRLFDIVPIARDTILERMSEGVVVLDFQERIVDINPSARSILGLNDGCIGSPIAVECPELVSEPREDLREFVRGHGFERRYFEIEEAPISDQSDLPRGTLIVFREITQRKRSEEEQIRTQRLAAVGELSAGISHNLNNILTGILAPADLLLEENQTSTHRRDLERIVAAAIRARDLVRRLRSTARQPDALDVTAVDIHEAVDDALVAAKPRLKDEPEAHGRVIDIQTDLQDVPQAQGTRLGLHNVLLNLLFNAVDAIDDKGKIRILTRSDDEDVIIEVSDDGIGMSEEVRTRVFEPFFTTKANVGTGLGLSTAYATVNKCGGTIDVESELDGGTTFRITLPVWKGRTPIEPVVEELLPDLEAQPPGRILLVEDDDIIQGVIEPVLTKAGHTVDVARDGEEAMSLLGQHKYDAGIVDLGLPKVSGDRVAMRIKQTSPETITILITGWDLDPDDPRLLPFDFQLWKPIEIRKLLNTLNHGLELKRSQDRDID